MSPETQIFFALSILVFFGVLFFLVVRAKSVPASKTPGRMPLIIICSIISALIALVLSLGMPFLSIGMFHPTLFASIATGLMVAYVPLTILAIVMGFKKRSALWTFAPLLLTLVTLPLLYLLDWYFR